MTSATSAALILLFSQGPCEPISAEIPVIAALGLTNRMEKRDDGLSVAEAIAQKTSNGQPIKYFQMSSAIDLLPAAYKQLAPGEKIAQALEQEFEQFGIEKLTIA